MRVLSPLIALLLLPGACLAGAWTLPAGSLWSKLAFSYQFAREFYADTAVVLPGGRGVEPGEARPYDDDGVSRQRVLYLEAEYGLTDRLTVGAQLPWKELRYEDRIQRTESWGWGDLKTSLRWALLTGTHRISARAAWKWPTGRFSTRTGTIPIGENQSDLELGLQWGRSLGRPLSWVGLEGGRRLRLRDRELDVDPGDEWFWWAEAGWGLDGRGRSGLKVAYRGSRGDSESLSFFAPGTALSRDLDEWMLVGMVDAGPLFFEVGWSHVVASETYPAAGVWTVSVSSRWTRSP